MADVDDKEFFVPQILMPVRRMLKILPNPKPLVLYDRRVDVTNSFSDVTNRIQSLKYNNHKELDMLYSCPAVSIF
jgi:hypothetical protein